MRSALPWAPASDDSFISTPSAGNADQAAVLSKASMTTGGRSVVSADAPEATKPVSSNAARNRTLALDTPHQHAAHIVALERQEQPQHRDHRDHRAGQHELRVLDMLATQAGERHRQREFALVAQHDERPQEVVPLGEEAER